MIAKNVHKRYPSKYDKKTKIQKFDLNVSHLTSKVISKWMDGTNLGFHFN